MQGENRRAYKMDIKMDEVAKKLSREAGVEIVPPPQVPHERIPTGIAPLDWLIEGIPLSAVTTFFGPESSGKTTIAAYVAAKFQQMGGIVSWIDTEYSFSTEYFQKIGVNTKNLLYTVGVTVEQAFKVMETVIGFSLENDQPCLVVWDSIAATPSEEEESRAFDESTVAAAARALSKGFRKLSVKLARQPKVAFLMITQVREDIGGSIYGTGYDMYGGRALKHYHMLALEFRRVGYIREEIPGVKAQILVAKSKLPNAPMLKGVSLYINYGYGVDEGKSLVDIAKDLGYIRVQGGWWKFSKGDSKAYRRNEIALELLKNEHKKALELLWREKNKPSI